MGELYSHGKECPSPTYPTPSQPGVVPQLLLSSVEPPWSREQWLLLCSHLINRYFKRLSLGVNCYTAKDDLNTSPRVVISHNVFKVASTQ